MKKILIIIAGIILFMPFVVSAESYTSADGKIYCAERIVPLGSNMICQYSVEFSNATVFQALLVPKGKTKIVEVRFLGTWNGTHNTVTNDVNATNPTPQNGKQAVMEIEFLIPLDYVEGEPCGVGVKYLDVETPTPVPIPTPAAKTGAFLPYMLVGGAAIVSLAIYLQTSRKEKFYKI